MHRLETTRLILRPWQQRDRSDLIEGLNDFEVTKWLAFVPHPYTAQDADRWIAFCLSLEGKQEVNTFEFAIELKAEEKVIGGVSLSRISYLHGTAGGGIWLNSKYQGQGYGREAFGEKIRFAFEDLNLRRLDNGYFEGNEASKRLQERLGYRIEGLKRQACRCQADNQLKDEYVTGLLREEWKRT